ncbi:MAG: hypothetical protein KJZ65_05550 [Phycisphaerales bacterium]|nr:hypothetical protein [Phycisphaerales bacterium]
MAHGGEGFNHGGSSCRIEPIDHGSKLVWLHETEQKGMLDRACGFCELHLPVGILLIGNGQASLIDWIASQTLPPSQVVASQFWHSSAGRSYQTADRFEPAATPGRRKASMPATRGL